MRLNRSSSHLNPHELKDFEKPASFEDEELNMNDQSEEGTAVDYESQAEATELQSSKQLNCQST